MTNATVKTRLCIISDTHTAIPFPTDDPTHIYRNPFPKSDVLFHCGDITKVGYAAEYGRVLSFLKTVPAELKLVIAGNHDITLHKELYLERLKNKHRNIAEDVDAIRELWTGEEARNAGIVYLEEGVKTFELGTGARFTVSAFEADGLNSGRRGLCSGGTDASELISCSNNQLMKQHMRKVTS